MVAIVWLYADLPALEGAYDGRSITLNYPEDTRLGCAVMRATLFNLDRVRKYVRRGMRIEANGIALY